MRKIHRFRKEMHLPSKIHVIFFRLFSHLHFQSILVSSKAFSFIINSILFPVGNTWIRERKSQQSVVRGTNYECCIRSFDADFKNKILQRGYFSRNRTNLMISGD